VGATLGRVSTHTFPDGESLVRVETNPDGRSVGIVATLRHPNELALPLLFLADTLRDLGATRVGLIAPYLAYMRQDARFHSGEALSARTFAAILSRSVDWIVTVEPHLHRFANLAEIFQIPASSVHVASELGSWICTHVRDPVVVGPDSESQQWAEAVAASAGAPCVVMTKIRRDDRDVVESVPELAAHANRTPVLVDDIISTGQTMIAAAKRFSEGRSRPVVCVGVHAVFAPGAAAALQPHVAEIATTNTILHPSNRIDVVDAMAQAVRGHLTDH
jgi:ribose-phosphate pyrophosphokinase